MKRLLSIFLLTVFVTNFSLGQKKIKDNVDVTYEMIFEGDEEMAAAASMMGESTMRVMYSDTKKSRATVEMMGGLVTTEVITNESGEFIMLMDMMGSKMKVAPTAEEMEGIIAEQAIEEDPEVTYQKEEVKDILGYKCHKVTVKTGESVVYMYVTDLIKVSPPKDYSNQSFDFSQVEGFPLEIITEEEGIKVSFIATKIGDLPENAFDYNDSEYEEMTFSELEALGEGM